MKCKDCNEEGCPYRAYTDDAECLYTPCREIEETSFDWQSFIAEAAKDILCAIINRESSFTRNGEVVISHKDFIEMAVEDADLLIAKLKEKKK